MRYQLLVLVLGAVFLSGVVIAQSSSDEVPTVEVAPTPKAADAPRLADPPDEPMASWPGPDGYNYKGSICTYRWLDITATGTPVSLNDDSVDGPFDIGFRFPFYNSVFDQFYVSSNGFISFDPLTSSYLSNHCPLPTPDNPNNIVALMWDDLDPGDTGDLLYYESFASCPVGGGRCLVVLYDDFCLYPGGSACATGGTFQAILYNDGTILVQFLDAGTEEGTNSTTGIEGDGAENDYALLYSCNSQDLTDNLCLEFDLVESPLLVTSIIHAPAVMTPGELVTYTLSISNTGLADANGTWLVDPIPANATLAYTVSPPSLIYNRLEDQVEWMGRVPRKTQINLTFAVTVAGACEDVITNTATITDPGIATTLTLQDVAPMWDLIHYSETFEGDDGGYAPGGSRSSWEWGSPRNGPGRAHSGTGAWATNLSGTYNDYEDSHITSPLINLRDAPRIPDRPVWLQWWHWFSSESCCDYGFVEVRGGDADWTPVTGEFRGDLQGWSLHRVDISEFAGAPDFQIRFRLHSDSIIRYSGWYVDDVAICQCSPSPGLYLGPDRAAAFGCVGVEQSHSFSLSNWTGAEGAFDLTYSLAEPTLGTITGPTLLSPANSTSANFTITLTPEVCLPDNLEMIAAVDAGGSGYTARSFLTKTLTTGFLPQWLPAGSTPVATRFHAVASHDGYLYQFGGEIDWWIPTNSVQRYHVASNTWSTAAPMPTASYGMDAVALGDRIYLPGGSDDTDDTGNGGTFLSQLLVYDPTADAWSTAQPLPVALAYASAVALDGKLYVVGGENDDGMYVDSLYIYDPSSDSWSAGASMGEGRAYAAAAAVAGKLYVAGGFAGGTTVLSTMEIYDPVSDTWSPGPALPKQWAPFGQGVLSDRYFVVYNGGSISYGGLGTGYGCSQDAYVYDTHTSQWIALPDLSRCLYGSQGATVDDRFYLVSGRTNIGGWQMAPQVDYMQACPICRALGWLDGYVYDYDAASATCTDATVHLEPGGANLSVAASGYYTMGLAPFDYSVTATADGYPEPGGPYTVTISAGATSHQNFALPRPDITVDPFALSATAAAPGTVTRVLTITNSGPYTLHFGILEAVPDSARAIRSPLALSQRESKSQPLAREPEIDVEPQLLHELKADESTGYLIYFRERPDLSAAFEMNWIDRGRFVVNALQEAANRSQERVRTYLDEQGVLYNAYWIDNIILVQSSTRAAFDHLLDFPEIGALLSRRHPILYEPVQQAAAGRSLTAVEPNLSHVGADRVWSELGVTGEGIVVANIDTGVRYTHEALVSQYRGNLGAGSFDHNHNWWDPALGGSDPVPNDWHGHGSHTMGTILGNDGDANQIGMAPGATWIACQAFEMMNDDELLECGQFMAAPWDLTGANPDADLRPHVINNSWGDCLQSADHWYDGIIDSWHAMGIYPVFSNGNASNCGYSSPPGCNTVGNPARAGNVTGVGSTGRDNGLYAPHSNWGPTDDPDTVNPDGYPSLKPQVLAPGLSIRSAYNTGDTAYITSGGTSMSAPHVTGLIALMWSAAPCLVGDYATTESILQETATPIPFASNCGGEGPDDLPNMASGWGEIDAYAAVDAAMTFCRADRLPWVKTDILSGSLGIAQQQPVQVTFTCTVTATQEPQPIEGLLRILHNDPCRDPVNVELGFYCSGQNPDPWWEKRLSINGFQAKVVEGPHTVQPGDTVSVVDWVGASFAEPVSSTLTEVWDDSLALVSYDAGGVGTVTTGDHTLAWNLVGVAPNAFYPITKTFEVQYGDWTAGTLRETYNVQHAVEQLPEVIIALEHFEPALTLDKRGPATAHDGEIIVLTLRILSQDNPWMQVDLTDPLPPGMTYAGNLTYSHGIAWEQDNTIHWTNSAGAAQPSEARLSINVGVLSPDRDPLQDLVDLLDGMDGIVAQRIMGDLSTLNIRDLTPYQVIVATNNNKWSEAGGNPNIGNILADYVSLGGKIILADFAWDDPAYGWQLEGRLMDEGYTPYRPPGSDLASASLGNYDPAHPVMQGVTDLSAIGTTAHQALALEAGATWIADWDDSQPCVYAQGEDVLGYNLLLDWSGTGWPWSGDVPALLENSILWLVSHITPLPPQVTITFEVQVTGEPGQVLRNTARLDWNLSSTDDVHDILVSDVPDVYLPIISRGY